MKLVYLDWNATAPPLPDALEATARTARDLWGNPASVHRLGREARRVLEDAREKIAALAGFDPVDLVFTSGGTEANNLAIRSLCTPNSHLVTSLLEHPSVVRVAQDLEKHGRPVTWIPLDDRGLVTAAAIQDALEHSDSPVVVALQAVNHETGVIQPVEQVIQIAHERGARVHVDAVQAVGKIADMPWKTADTVSLAAHKLRGPKGIGALVGSRCAEIHPLMFGGPHERGARPGTVSAALAAGFGVAAEWATQGPSRYAAIQMLRDRLEDALVRAGALRNGTATRVPHGLNVSFPGLHGDEVVASLDQFGVCVSSGAACSASSPEQSSVVSAMLGAERALGAVRFSLGETTTSDEITRAIEACEQLMARARIMDEVVAEVGSEVLENPWKNGL